MYKYKLEKSEDTVAKLNVAIHQGSMKQILQLTFNGKVVAAFDHNGQLGYLSHEHMGEWREAK